MSANPTLKEFFKTFTVTLEPITPVHVWGGWDALTGVDALVDGKDLVIVDLDESLKRIPEERLNDLIKPQNIPEAAEALTAYLTRLYKEGLLIGFKVPIRALPPRPNKRVKVLHRNIVPGSELKGYIRTAILKKLLKSEKQPQNIIVKGVNLRAEPKNMGTGVEAQLLRSPRLGEQGGFVDALSMISISDPLNMENIQRSLRKLQVVRIAGLSRVASLYAVTFDQGRLIYRVNISKFNSSPIGGDERFPRKIAEKMTALSEMFKEKKWLLTTLREFGCELIDIELKKINNIEKLKGYRELLNKMKADLCSGGEGLHGKNTQFSNCVPARIGFMTGHESKTILPDVQNYAPQTYKKIRHRMKRKLGRVWDSRTLKLVELDGKLVGVGWCRICIE